MNKKFVYGSALLFIIILFFIVYYSKISLSTLRVTNIFPISIFNRDPATTTDNTVAITTPTAQGEKIPVEELSNYIEVIDSCNPYYVGECVNVRSGPDTSYPVVTKLRTGVVLKVGATVTENGEDWYKIIFT